MKQGATLLAFQDGEGGHELANARNAVLEISKGKESDSSLEPLQEAQSCQCWPGETDVRFLNKCVLV